MQLHNYKQRRHANWALKKVIETLLSGQISSVASEVEVHLEISGEAASIWAGN